MRCAASCGDWWDTKKTSFGSLENSDQVRNPDRNGTKKLTPLRMAQHWRDLKTVSDDTRLVKHSNDDPMISHRWDGLENVEISRGKNKRMAMLASPSAAGCPKWSMIHETNLYNLRASQRNLREKDPKISLSSMWRISKMSSLKIRNYRWTNLPRKAERPGESANS